MSRGYHGSQSENVTFDMSLIHCTVKRRAGKIKLRGAYPNTKSHTDTLIHCARRGAFLKSAFSLVKTIPNLS